jgi:hypothetical protein
MDILRSTRSKRTLWWWLRWWSWKSNTILVTYNNMPFVYCSDINTPSSDKYFIGPNNVLGKKKITWRWYINIDTRQIANFEIKNCSGDRLLCVPGTCSNIMQSTS